MVIPVSASLVIFPLGGKITTEVGISSDTRGGNLTHYRLQVALCR